MILIFKAYWRSCSLLLGYVFETSFKENHFIDICSFPPPFSKYVLKIFDFQSFILKVTLIIS